MTEIITSNVLYRDIESIEEMHLVEDIQAETWGMSDREIVPFNQLTAAKSVGATLIGAFDGEALVGFAYGFYGYFRGHIVHHSHQLAVRPGLRGQDVGFHLKSEQRERVLRDGITNRITWTFDPLRSLNAYFNFSKLGVLSDTYKVNVYGETGTGFLHRNGTDRLFVTWLIDNEREKARDIDEEPDVLLMRNSASDSPEPSTTAIDLSTAETAAIEIPIDIQSIEQIDFEKAAEWRTETRRLFQNALKAGMIVTDYVRSDTRTGRYLLRRGSISDFSWNQCSN